MKKKIAFYLDDSGTAGGRALNLALLAVNLLACILYVVGTYLPENAAGTRTWLFAAEIAVVAIFSAEYLLRLWIAERRLRYMFSFYGLVDLVSILPSIVTIQGMAFLRALKVLRVLKFIRYLETEEFFFGRLSEFQLQVARTVFTVFTILFVASGLIFQAESLAPPDSGAVIKTFGEAFYYSVITLSTVGYGHFVCVTALGRTFTVVMIMGGAILIPWQVGKLVRLLIHGERKRPVVCSQCGLKWHDYDASHCKACGNVIYQEYEGDD